MGTVGYMDRSWLRGALVASLGFVFVGTGCTGPVVDSIGEAATAAQDGALCNYYPARRTYEQMEQQYEDSGMFSDRLYPKRGRFFAEYPHMQGRGCAAGDDSVCEKVVALMVTAGAATPTDVPCPVLGGALADPVACIAATLDDAFATEDDFVPPGCDGPCDIVGLHDLPASFFLSEPWFVGQIHKGDENSGAYSAAIAALAASPQHAIAPFRSYGAATFPTRFATLAADVERTEQWLGVMGLLREEGTSFFAHNHPMVCGGPGNETVQELAHSAIDRNVVGWHVAASDIAGSGEQWAAGIIERLGNPRFALDGEVFDSACKGWHLTGRPCGERAKFKDAGIVLLDASSPTQVRDLDVLVRALLEDGYRFVTVDDQQLFPYWGYQTASRSIEARTDFGPNGGLSFPDASPLPQGGVDEAFAVVPLTVGAEGEPFCHGFARVELDHTNPQTLMAVAMFQRTDGGGIHTMPLTGVETVTGTVFEGYLPAMAGGDVLIRLIDPTMDGSSGVVWGASVRAMRCAETGLPDSLAPADESGAGE